MNRTILPPSLAPLTAGGRLWTSLRRGACFLEGVVVSGFAPLRRCVLLVGLLVAAGSAEAQWESDTDRPGGDYSRFSVGADPNECMAACGRDTRCAAWTWVKAGIQGSDAQCWLKDRMPGAVGSDCCVSGVNQLWFNRNF